MFASAKGKQENRLDSYSARNSVLIISHVTFRDCRVQFFFQQLSQNTCIFLYNDDAWKRISSIRGIVYQFLLKVEIGCIAFVINQCCLYFFK